MGEVQDLAAEHAERFGTGPVSIEPYISEDYFELERERLFKKVWLHTARANEIPNPGDFIVKDIDIAKASVIIVRGKDMQIRAFYNVCSHRASKLVWDDKGSLKRFICNYHAWTYGLDGDLIGVPGENHFPGIDRKRCGLTPVACDVWEGFIFLNLDPEPKQSLREYLGSFADYASGFPFDEADASIRLEFGELRSNWKTALDAFQETYHLGFLHKQTLSGVFTSPKKPLGRPLAFQAHGPHRVVSTWANPQHEAGQVEALARTFGSTINATTGETRSSTQEKLFERAPGLNPSRHPNWALDINVIFPHTVWLAIPGQFTIQRFWPISVNRTRYEAYSYYPQPKRASERLSREYGFCHFRGVVSEDVYNMEYSQAAMESGVKKSMPLMDGEVAIRHHLSEVDRYVKADA